MSTVPPVTLQKFDAVPFQPDGGVPIGGLLLAMLFTFGAALVIGLVVSILHQWFYLVILFPLLMGLGVGMAGALGLKQGKVRSTLVGTLLGIAGGVQVMLVSHYVDYQRTLREVNKLAPGLQAENEGFTFATFMELRANDGVKIGKVGRGGDKGMNLGHVGSYIYWLVEMLLAAGVAWYTMKGVADEPFCSTCQSWKDGQVIGGISVGRESVKEIMNQGDLPQLLRPDLPTGSPVIFTAHACPTCAEQGTLEINLKEVTVNAKGEQQQTSLGTWSFPWEALPAWQSVFTAREQALEPPALEEEVTQ